MSPYDVGDEARVSQDWQKTALGSQFSLPTYMYVGLELGPQANSSEALTCRAILPA